MQACIENNMVKPYKLVPKTFVAPLYKTGNARQLSAVVRSAISVCVVSLNCPTMLLVVFH